MAGYESTTIIGNVGRDVESRQTASGSNVSTWSVAVTTKWTDSQSGEKREKVNWYKVTAWGKLAEIAAQYVKKGAQIMVVGTVTASAYMGQDGEPRASLELRADTFQLLGSNAARDESEYEDATSIPF
jgi:single-strand DNA-binding protein